MIRLAAPILCLAIVVCAHAQPKKNKSADKTGTIFSVHKKPTSSAEFIYLYKKNHQNKPEEFTREKIEEYLTLFINFKLKVEEARSRGLDTTAAFVQEFNQYRDELRKPYLPEATLVDSLVKLTYERMQSEVKASHILLNLKPEATPEDTARIYNRIIQIRNEILAGKKFGDAAVAYSEDPSAKVNNGSLGYFTALQMVYPFENAAYSTPVGQISKPIRTRFGYHLVYVEDRRPARGEVEVSHIMIRGADNDTKSRDKIFEIYDQLKAGVSWDELCKQYSEDPGSKDNGGKLRPFGVGVMSGIPAFESTAFSLVNPGEISDPFRTQYGWHVMRLERKIPLAPFSELSANLKNRVARDERTQLSKQALQTKLRKDFAFQENAAVKSKAFHLADTTLQKGKWKIPAAAAQGETLFNLGAKKFTVQEFFKYVVKNQRPNTQAPEKYFDQLYNQFVDARILDAQEQRIIEANPEYNFLLKEYYEGILLFDIMEKEVWNKASADSIGQHKYYTAHATDYQAPERARASLFFGPTADFREPLKAVIVQKNEKAVQDYVSSNKIRSESGYFTKGEKDILNKVSWATGLYPLEENGMYYLAWLKEILPAGTMSFEEARPSVISDYQTFVEKGWIEQLKKKYTVSINEKGKEYVFTALEKN
jgi:peptidyl-prolyl cis-trans isomerase SurA